MKIKHRYIYTALAFILPLFIVWIAGFDLFQGRSKELAATLCVSIWGAVVTYTCPFYNIDKK